MRWATVGAAVDHVQILPALLFTERPEDFSAVLFGGVPRKRERAGNDGRRRTRAAAVLPAAFAVSIIQRHVPGDRRHVVGRSSRAPGIVLPRGFRDLRSRSRRRYRARRFRYRSNRVSRGACRRPRRRLPIRHRGPDAVAVVTGGSKVGYARRVKGLALVAAP